VSDPTDDVADDPRVLTIAREYLAELEAGAAPDRQAYLDRYPDVAGAVAECLDGVELAHAAGRAIRPGPAPTAELPAEPLGDFKILRELGRGGMGVVYEAVQLSLGRRVALKVLPFAAALDAKHLQRFRTESHAAAQLHHTNIVPVYAVGCERGVHYYAMQIIDGRPLDEVIAEARGERGGGSTVEFKAVPTDPATGATTRAGRGRETYRTAARIALQVADALEYAHDAGVVHRDVKPANLLLDARGTVWVTDFGLAQVTSDPGVTRTGDVFGTLRYMSPEQAGGRRVEVDHRTDVYSLGATLFELLTLEPMVPGQDRPAVLHQILTEDPRPPRQLDRGVPVDLETIVLKAVAKSPADRYPTAGEMAADLRRFLDGRPITARRPSLFDLARKWVRRHPAYVGAAVLLLVFGVIGLTVATALVAHEKTRAEQALDGEKRRAAEAQERFELARRSADDMIRIADQELGYDPESQFVRRRLLEAALTYYQEFIELRKDDPSAQAELEHTRDRVKAILADLRVLSGAMQHLLLLWPPVQADLKLTAEQKTAVAGIMQDVGGDPRSPRPWPDPRPRKMLDEVKAHQSAIEAVLSPAQLARLGQIALQASGAMAFRESDVIDRLGLTPEQRKEIREIEREPFGPGPSKKGRDQGPRFGTDRVLALLTPEQRTIWKEMIGSPYNGPTFHPGMGRGFGGKDGGPPRGRPKDDERNGP
jgi:serine/threonine protein kinase